MWAWARPVIGVGLLGALVAHVGPAPFVDGVRTVGAGPLALALGLTTVTTLAAALRWSLVAGQLGVELTLRQAVAAYYRSQFLNATLPGGVLGDVHRAVRHGRAAGSVGRGVRSVAWERACGQAVQVGLTVLVLLLLPSPWRIPVGVVALVLVAALVAALAAALVLRGLRGRFTGRLTGRVAGAIGAEVRQVLLAPAVLPVVALTSVVTALGHAVTFLVATWAVGVPASPAALLPLALVVLLASAVPISVAGWGPREGAAAWAFGAAGLGAAQGVTVAVVYGVLALVATLPGAVLLLLPARDREDDRALGGAPSVEEHTSRTREEAARA